MADAFFSFSTDIEATARQIAAGMQAINQSLASAKGVNVDLFGNVVKAAEEAAVKARAALAGIGNQRLGQVRGGTLAGGGADLTANYKTINDAARKQAADSIRAQSQALGLSPTETGALIKRGQAEVSASIKALYDDIARSMAKEQGLSKAAFLRGAIPDSASRRVQQAQFDRQAAKDSAARQASGVDTRPDVPTAAVRRLAALEAGLPGGKNEIKTLRRQTGLGADQAADKIKAFDAQFANDYKNAKARQKDAEDQKGAQALVGNLEEKRLRGQALIDKRIADKATRTAEQAANREANEFKRSANAAYKAQAERDLLEQTRADPTFRRFGNNFVGPNEVRRVAGEGLRVQRNDATAQRVREQLAARDEAQNVTHPGILESFLSGATSKGIGGGSGTFSGNLSGLAISAGTLVKFAALREVMQAVTQGVADLAHETLDFVDSQTAFNIALGNGDKAGGAYLSTLTDISRAAGSNVGEALDTAARAIGAFSKAGQDQDQRQDIGRQVTQVASQLRVITGKDLKDVTGDLIAIGNAFNTAPDQLQQVNDAIANARKNFGKDPGEISQGLANFGVVAKQSGLDLNESANLIALASSRLDESGTLTATRLSKVFAIIGGQSGQTFIADLNQQLASSNTTDKQTGQVVQVDQTKTGMAALQDLARAYKELDAAGKSAFTSRLGGTANSREFITILTSMDDLLAKNAESAHGAGEALDEYHKRLNDITGTITQLKGAISAIEVDLGRSGLLDIFGVILKTVQPLLVALGKMIELYDALPSKLRSVLGITLELLLAQRLMVAAAARGFVVPGAIGRYATRQAYASDRGTGLYGGGRIKAPLEAAEPLGPAVRPTPVSFVRNPEGLARRAALAENAAGARALTAAEAELTKARVSQAEASYRVTTLEARLAAIRAGALAGTDAETAAEAQLTSAKSRLALTSTLVADAENVEMLARERNILLLEREALVAQEAAAKRAASSAVTGRPQGFGPVIPGTYAAEQAAARAAGAAPVVAGTAVSTGAAVAGASATKIGGMEAGAALRTGAAAAGRTAVEAAKVAGRVLIEGAKVAGFSKDIPGGAPRESLRDTLAGRKPVGQNIGGFGTALIAAGGIFAVVESFKKTNEIMKAAAAAGDQLSASGGATTDSLNQAAADLRTKAKAAKESSAGIFGSTLNFALGNETGKTAKAARAQADIFADTAAQLAKANTADARVSGTPDLSVATADDLSAGLKRLTDAGRDAGTQFDALYKALKNLGDPNSKAVRALTPGESRRVAIGAGGAVAADLVQTQEFARIAGKSSLPFGDFLTVPTGDQRRDRKDEKLLAGADKKKIGAGVTDEIEKFRQDNGGILPEDKKRELLDIVQKRIISDFGPEKFNALSKERQKQVLGAATLALAQQRSAIQQVDDPTASLAALIANGSQAATGKSALDAQRASLYGTSDGGPNRAADGALVGAQNRVKYLQGYIAQARAKGATDADLENLKNDLDSAELDLQKKTSSHLDALLKLANADSPFNKAQNLQDKLNTLNAKLDVNAPGHLTDEAERAAAEAEKKQTETDIATEALATRAAERTAKTDPRDKKTSLANAVTTAQEELKRLQDDPNAGARELAEARAKLAAANIAVAEEDVAESRLAAQSAISPYDAIGKLKEATTAAKAATVAAKATGIPALIDAAKIAEADAAKAQAEATIAAANAMALSAIDPRNLLAVATERAKQSAEQVKRDKTNGATGAQVGADITAAAADAQAVIDQQIADQNSSDLLGVDPRNTKGLADLAVTQAAAAVRRLQQDKITGQKLNDALRALQQAQLAAIDATIEADSTDRQSKIDLTDPAAVAAEAAQTAKERLQKAQESKADPTTIQKLTNDSRLADSNAENVALDQRLSTLQSNLALGRISHQEYIKGLMAEKARLEAIGVLTYAQDQELRKITGLIKDSAKSLDGQFNIGDIKLPTVYQVRSSIANAAASPGAGNSTQNVNVTINGGDMSQVVALLSTYFGAQAFASTTVSPTKV